MSAPVIVDALPTANRIPQQLQALRHARFGSGPLASSLGRAIDARERVEWTADGPPSRRHSQVAALSLVRWLAILVLMGRWAVSPDPSRKLLALATALIVLVSVIGLTCVAVAGDGHGPGHWHGGPGLPMSGIAFAMPGEDRSSTSRSGADSTSPGTAAIFVPPRI